MSVRKSNNSMFSNHDLINSDVDSPKVLQHKKQWAIGFHGPRSKNA